MRVAKRRARDIALDKPPVTDYMYLLASVVVRKFRGLDYPCVIAGDSNGAFHLPVNVLDANFVGTFAYTVKKPTLWERTRAFISSTWDVRVSASDYVIIAVSPCGMLQIGVSSWQWYRYIIRVSKKMKIEVRNATSVIKDLYVGYAARHLFFRLYGVWFFEKPVAQPWLWLTDLMSMSAYVFLWRRFIRMFSKAVESSSAARYDAAWHAVLRPDILEKDLDDSMLLKFAKSYYQGVESITVLARFSEDPATDAWFVSGAPPANIRNTGISKFISDVCHGLPPEDAETPSSGDLDAAEIARYKHATALDPTVPGFGPLAWVAPPGAILSTTGLYKLEPWAKRSYTRDIPRMPRRELDMQPDAYPLPTPWSVVDEDLS